MCVCMQSVCVLHMNVCTCVVCMYECVVSKVNFLLYRTKILSFFMEDYSIEHLNYICH